MRFKLTVPGSLALALMTLLGALSLAAVPAAAADPAFAGKWAEDIATCKLGQDDQNAPLIITKGGYDQHEAHCKFKKLEGSGNEWKADAECSVEGDSQSTSFTFSVSGDTLTIGEDGSTRDYLRCK